jgi:DNA-binding NtrC family response regulator
MNPPRVLIADDDPALLGLMVRRLVRMGMPPDAAGDGVQAAALIQANSYDLIISDINMPGKTGLELLQEAKQRDPNVQVVIVTGGATLESAVQALNQGAFGYLTKPFDHMSVLENAASRALEFRRLTLDNLRMAEVQKKRGDLLQDEVADRLKQVNRQDREMRQILATLPEGILIVGGRRAVVPYNPAAQRFQSLDAQPPIARWRLTWSWRAASSGRRHGWCRSAAGHCGSRPSIFRRTATGPVASSLCAT